MTALALADLRGHAAAWMQTVGAPPAVELTLAPGARTTQRLTPAAGAWLRIEVRSTRLDLTLTLDGSAAVNDTGAGGTEVVELVTSADGPRAFSIHAAPGDGATDTVSVRTTWRLATAADRARVTAIDDARRRHRDALEALAPLEAGRGLDRADAEALSRTLDALAAAWPPLGRPDLAADALTYQARLATNVFEDLAVSKPLLERALALPDLPAIVRGTALNDLAVVEDRLGNPTASVARLEAAVALGRDAGDPANHAVQTSNLGLAYFRRDRYEEALARQRDAAAAFRRLAMPDREALTLSDLAGTWEAMGETDTALAVQQQAVDTARRSTSLLAQAVTLGNLGRRLQRLERRDEARPPLEEAQRLAVTLGNRRIESAMVAALGRLELDLGHADAALVHAARASSLATAIANPVSEGTALLLRGEALLRTDERDGAFLAVDEALTRFARADSRTDLIEALRLRAQLHVGRGDLDGARADLARAIAEGDAARAELLAPDARATFAATRDRVFGDFVDVCLRQHALAPDAGHAAAALEAFERLRAASLRDLLAEARADVRSGGDATVIARERAVRESLDAKRRAHAAASARPTAARLATTLSREVTALQAELRVLERQLREGSPRYAALTAQELLTTRDIQQRVLDADTVLLAVIAADARSWIVAVTPDRVDARPLPPRATLDAAAREAARAVAAAGDGRQRSGPALQRLSDVVLGPIADELAGTWRGRRLAVIASGALEYVPIAALPYPAGSPPGHAAALGLDREVVGLPSASVLHDLRRDLGSRSTAARTIAVVADPVFSADDPRVPATGAVTTAPAPGAPSFSRLPFTRDEAAAITALTPASARRVVTGFAATREWVLTGGLAGARVVHVATHGVFNADHPELSGLVFSTVDRQGRPTPGFLRADAIFNLKVDADLVVLSACETALGRVLRGEGLTGMTRAWMYAGAPRVVASLWRVDDAATAALMRHFYQGLIRDRRPAAAALAEARKAVARMPGWRDPYYWAGFVLQGDWR